MENKPVHVRWEIWLLSDHHGTVAPERFNACFETRAAAQRDEHWYKRHGYITDIRVRTTRFQRQAHVTSGGPPGG